MAALSYIVIIGCGRLGSLLANKLSKEGHSVVVIDSDENAFKNLSEDFSGFKVSGNAAHAAVLKQAKVDKADVVITTTRDDNINLMVAQVAKTVYRVSRVIARVYDPSREIIYGEFGVETVSPTVLAAIRILGYVRDNRKKEQL